jgi:integrase
MKSLKVDKPHNKEYVIIAEIMQAQKAMQEAKSHLDNLKPYLSQDAPFLPSETEGEGEMAKQYKDRLQVGINPDGKPKIVWVTGVNKQTFYDNLVRTYAQHGMLDRLGIQVVNPAISKKPVMKQEQKPDVPTFKEYTKKLISMRMVSLRPNSNKSYDNLMRKHFIPFFGDMPLNEITWYTVQGYLNARKEMGKETLRTHLARLRVVFASAMEDGIITVNPAKNRNIKNPGQILPEREALTEQQREQVARALPAMDEKDARYVAICLYAATRKSETLGLQWKHVTEQEIQVRQQCQVNNNSFILPPKSDCGKRNIPIQDRLKPYLANHGNDEEYLFGKGTKPPTKYMFEQMWKRIETHLNGIDISSHILRHTFITECAEKNVPVNVTQKIAGHSKPSITYDVYTHVTDTLMQDAMSKINS